MSTAKNFYIYDNGLFKNFDKLNPTGQVVYNVLQELNNKSFGLFDDWKFWKDVTTILVTSQKRDWGGYAHKNNLAIDINVQPDALTPFVFAYLYRLTPYNIFISLHNKHIHIDSYITQNRNHIKGAEKKINNVIEIISISQNVAESIVNFYISSIPTTLLYLSSPGLATLKQKGVDILREKVSTEEVDYNRKVVRNEVPSYLDAFFGLIAVTTIAGIGYILYKKKKSKNKKEIPENESRKKITE